MADLLATVHYVSRGAAIWDLPKLVKRPFDVTHALHSQESALVRRPEGFESASLDLASSRADFLLPCTACCQLCFKAPHLVCNLWKTFLCIITACVINFA